jgi:hypothetical protein
MNSLTIAKKKYISLKYYKKIKKYFNFLSIYTKVCKVTDFILLHYSYYDITGDFLFKHYLKDCGKLTFCLKNISKLKLSTKKLNKLDYYFKNKVIKFKKNSSLYKIFYFFYLKFNILLNSSNFFFQLDNFTYNKDFINMLNSNPLPDYVDFMYVKLNTHIKFISISFLCNFILKYKIKDIQRRILRLLVVQNINILKILRFRDFLLLSGKHQDKTANFLALSK